ncbi:DUF7933 domain-containing protein [Algibacter pacificus]|uniref:DUF7933 domain-containing protein n=1 Tax=Algibacter pacificus TaxID=2599389 RepID=UPI0011C91268|nr:DUF11 domain-containing protein [Algibacter pacificus]
MKKTSPFLFLKNSLFVVVCFIFLFNNVTAQTGTPMTFNTPTVLNGTNPGSDIGDVGYYENVGTYGGVSFDMRITVLNATLNGNLNATVPIDVGGSLSTGRLYQVLLNQPNALSPTWVNGTASANHEDTVVDFKIEFLESQSPVKTGGTPIEVLVNWGFSDIDDVTAFPGTGNGTEKVEYRQSDIVSYELSASPPTAVAVDQDQTTSIDGVTAGNFIVFSGTQYFIGLDEQDSWVGTNLGLVSSFQFSLNTRSAVTGYIWESNIPFTDSEITPIDPCVYGATEGMSTAKDPDGDGINNICDEDDDNDGLLDVVEERCDQPSYANSNSGSGAFQDQLYIFNWSNIGGSLENGDTQTFTVNDLVITATFSNVVITGGTVSPSELKTWSDALIGDLYNTSGGQEALYGDAATQSFLFTVSFTATKNGSPYPLDIIAIDAESTTDGTSSGLAESISFTSNGGEWTFLEGINGSGTGPGEFVVNHQQLTVVDTFEGADKGNSLYYSKDATSIDVSVSSGNTQRQGVAFGIFLYCDTDGDGVIDNLDTDSDNDGCPDALEGNGAIVPSQLTDLTGGSNGGSLGHLGMDSDDNGSPKLLPTDSSGYTQDTTAAVRDENDNVACTVDLSLTKTVNTKVVKLGSVVTYTFTVKNAGPLEATNVNVTDVLPTGLTYSGTANASQGTYNSGTGVWTVGALAKDQEETLQIQATVNAVGLLTNKAEVTATDQEDIDSTPANNK